MLLLKPALTAKEWEAGRVEFKIKSSYDHYGIELTCNSRATSNYPNGAEGYVTVFDGSWAAPIKTEHQHAAAALLLCGQPFGFTWEDVDSLAGEQAYYECGHDEAKLASIADRIAALLPPRSKPAQ